MVRSVLDSFRFGVDRANARKAQREQAERDEFDRQRALVAEDKAIARQDVLNQRKDNAFNALQGQFGDVAGDPAAFGQLSGIDQRQQAFDIDKANAAQDQQLDASIRAVNFLRSGGSFEQLRPALGALGIDEAQAATLEQAIGQDPSILDSLHAGLVGQKKDGLNKVRGAPIKAIGPDGKPVFFQQFADGTVEQVDGFSPTPAAKRSSGGGGGKSSFAEKIEFERQKAFARREGDLNARRAAEDAPLSGTELAKQETRMREFFQGSTATLDVLDKASAQVSPLSAGLAASTAWIPGSPAHALRARLLPAVAKEFTSNLQRMRELSKTGGAVGNVSDKEGDKIQSIRANLDTAQNPRQLLEAIDQLRTAITQANSNIQAAFDADQAARNDDFEEVQGELDDEALFKKHRGGG